MILNKNQTQERSMKVFGKNKRLKRNKNKILKNN